MTEGLIVLSIIETINWFIETMVIVTSQCLTFRHNNRALGLDNKYVYRQIQLEQAQKWTKDISSLDWG